MVAKDHEHFYCASEAILDSCAPFEAQTPEMPERQPVTPAGRDKGDLTHETQNADHLPAGFSVSGNREKAVRVCQRVSPMSGRSKPTR